jgi:hypothetical protein
MSFSYYLNYWIILLNIFSFSLGLLIIYPHHTLVFFLYLCLFFLINSGRLFHKLHNSQLTMFFQWLILPHFLLTFGVLSGKSIVSIWSSISNRIFLPVCFRDFFFIFSFWSLIMFWGQFLLIYPIWVSHQLLKFMSFSKFWKF